jgi:hypothetical protein
VGATTGELGRDGGQNAVVAYVVFGLEAGEPLEIDPRSIGLEPIEDFIEEPGIVPGDGGRKQQERFGIDHPVVPRLRVAGHPKGGPLTPKESEERLAELLSKAG